MGIIRVVIVPMLISDISDYDKAPKISNLLSTASIKMRQRSISVHFHFYARFKKKKKTELRFLELFFLLRGIKNLRNRIDREFRISFFFQEILVPYFIFPPQSFRTNNCTISFLLFFLAHFLPVFVNFSFIWHPSGEGDGVADVRIRIRRSFTTV